MSYNAEDIKRLFVDFVDQGVLAIVVYVAGAVSNLPLIYGLGVLYAFIHLLAIISFRFRPKIQIHDSVGVSMKPSIPSGIVYTPGLKNPDQIEVGDVICYRSLGGSNLLHRVVDKKNGVFVTQGDNNPKPDTFTVKEEEIVCRVPQIGNQPIYIPFSARSVFGTISKIPVLVQKSIRTIENSM